MIHDQTQHLTEGFQLTVSTDKSVTDFNRERFLQSHASSVVPHPFHTSLNIKKTRQTERASVKDTAGLTVLEGAARVSISSWVTHTLPDGYEGQSPRDRAAGLVVEVR